MKKISLITVHLGPNFGSNLQTIATVRTLEKFQTTVQVINYIPNRCTTKRFLKHSFSSPLNFIKLFISFPLFLINRHIYNSYLKKHVNISEPIYSNDIFYKVCPKADYYVTGSDQVWNTIYNEGIDKHYFFDGFKSNNKIAYSSSMGKTQLEKEEYSVIKDLLSSYKAISVREDTAKHIIESMGYEATHLLDPTFMLNASEWKKYMSKRLIDPPYIIVYLPYNTHDKNIIYKSVRKIANALNLKIVTFSLNIFNDKYADTTIRFASPGDFLSLMYYAEYVVTNSFHGTAFSINLNKQFYVYMPTGFGTRIMSILEKTGLTNRLLEAKEIVSSDKIHEKINYDIVNYCLDKERQIAFNYLRKALND